MAGVSLPSRRNHDDAVARTWPDSCASSDGHRHSTASPPPPRAGTQAAPQFGISHLARGAEHAASQRVSSITALNRQWLEHASDLR
jgi:hypothetical protein